MVAMNSPTESQWDVMLSRVGTLFWNRVCVCGGGGLLLLTTKMQLIRVHAHNVFSLFMEFGGPPRNHPPLLPPGSAPVKIRELVALRLKG